MNKSQKQAEIKKDDGVELETQFILRMPEEPAKLLREAISTNTLKDRLTIKMEQDLRYGEVRFDHYFLHTKIVDLPTITESLKTIDSKSFYKTADICQMVMCSEEADAPSAEEESPNKAKKKDPNKVDKKFLWPHGVTPPTKNIRKRRFRKTLKKKYVEAPEIEKEVKRLLRIDNDAVSVKYEIILEDDENLKNEVSENASGKDQASNGGTDEEKLNDSFRSDIPDKLGDIIDSENEQDTERQAALAEHDIFGGEVSSSDEENNRANNIQDNNSRFSAEDSHLSEYLSHGGRESPASGTGSKNIITQFNKSMFEDNFKDSVIGEQEFLEGQQDHHDNFYDQKANDSDDYDFVPAESQMTKEEINSKILELRQLCDDLKIQHNQKSNEISSIVNQTLKQRLQDTVDNLLSQIVEKEMEIQDYQNILQRKANA